MTVYRINASLRNKAGKEIAHRTPLWVGDAPSVRAALNTAKDHLKPHMTPLVDTIVLHSIDDKGGRTTATEYAEDITHGVGTSLGTSLLDEHADHGLTPEQIAAAQAGLEKRALAAIPEVKIIGRVMTRRESDGIQHTYEIDEDGLTLRELRPYNGEDMIGDDTPLDEFLKTGKAVLNGKIVGISTVPIDAIYQISEDGSESICPSDLMHAGAAEVKDATGVTIKEAIVNRATYDQMKKDLGMGPQCDLIRQGGIKITVTDEPTAPSISLIQPMRYYDRECKHNLKDFGHRGIQ